MRRLRTFAPLTALAAALALLPAWPALAQPADDDGPMSLDEISRMLDNPLGNLWIVFLENG